MKTKNKMQFLAEEIVALKKFQYRIEISGIGNFPKALDDTIEVMEKQFWFKYNNLKGK